MSELLELAVADLALSTRFYIALFGWQAGGDQEFQTLSARGKERLRLRLRKVGESSRSVFEQRESGIVILTRNLAHLKQRLRDKRILFKESHERKIEIIDPDQNLIIVRQRRPKEDPSVGMTTESGYGED